MMNTFIRSFAEINTENTINKKVKVKLYTNRQNKKNTKNIQILKYLPLLGQHKYQRNADQS